MFTDKIASVFNEPDCETNRNKTDAEKKKGCTIKGLTPGAAAGGCAFDGAKIALQPITDVVHLVHGPIACEGNSWDTRNTGSSGPMIYRWGFTTDMSEMDIIHGGEKKLWKAIKEAIARYNPPAVFVYQTCVPALIGDDIETVCKTATERLGVPVVPVMAPGFAGSKNLGNKLGGEALLGHVIGTREPDDVSVCDINVLGEYNVAGEFWLVRPLLERLGIRIRACITGDARYEEVAAAHTANINMMVCSQALMNLARGMRERWGIPYFEGSFYGIQDTSDSLRQIARMLVERGAPADLIDRTEALIEEEERALWAAMDAYRPRLEGKKVLLYTGGVKSWSVVHALKEMGMIVVSTSVRKSTEEDKVRAKEALGDDGETVGAISAPEMYRMFTEGEADIMLSGGRSQFTALKARTAWLDINQERHVGYEGYAGMLNLVQQMDLEVNNPVWEQVRTPAPWDLQEA